MSLPYVADDLGSGYTTVGASVTFKMKKRNGTATVGITNNVYETYITNEYGNILSPVSLPKTLIQGRGMAKGGR